MRIWKWWPVGRSHVEPRYRRYWDGILVAVPPTGRGRSVPDVGPVHSTYEVVGTPDWAGGPTLRLGGTSALSGPSVTLSDYTVSIQYTPDTISGAHTILDEGDILVYQFDDGIAYGFTSAGVPIVNMVGGTLSARNSTNIVVTRSGGTYTLYLDGREVDSFTNSSTPTSEGNVVVGRRASAIYADLNGSSMTYYRADADFLPSGICGAHDLTIQMWINPATLGTEPLMTKVDGGNRQMYALLIFNGKLRLEISEDGSSANRSNSESSLGVVAGEWQHVAAVYDASAGTVDFYRNGALLNQATGARGSIADKDPTFRIGFYFSSWFNGCIGPSALLDDKRTEGEIAASAADWGEDLSGDGNIIGQWMFTEDSTATFIVNRKAGMGGYLVPYNNTDTTYGNAGRSQGYGNCRVGALTIWGRALAPSDIRELGRDPNILYHME